MKIRLAITKGEAIRYISHLDYAKTVEKAIRRAKLPAAYSAGFNPHMKLAFASALAVGVTSASEYIDLELISEQDCQQIQTRLAAQFPQGIECLAGKMIGDKEPALMSVVNLATYSMTVGLTTLATEDKITAILNDFNDRAELHYLKHSPKGNKQIDVKLYVDTIDWIRQDQSLRLLFAVKITALGSMKPVEVLDCLERDCGLPILPDTAMIHRTALYIVQDGVRFTPLEIGERKTNDPKDNNQCHS